MLLNGHVIKSEGLIENPNETGFRGASYDVHAGKIIPISGEEKASFVLKPQGTVLVISKERVRLPSGVAGYATVKTSLCQDGILATNIGIIDPGYRGPVSTYLINFGKSEFNIGLGDPFLRLAFHRFEPHADFAPKEQKTEELYIRERKREVVSYLSDTFLDLPSHIKKVTNEVFQEAKKRLLVWAPLVGVALTLFVFGVTLGVTYSGREVPSKEQLKADLAAELNARFTKDLEDRLRRIETELSQADRNKTGSETRTNPSTPAKNGR